MQSLEDKYETYWQRLDFKWGIKCPNDCACKDPKVRQLLAEAGELHFDMDALSMEGKTEEALTAGQKLRTIQNLVNLEWNIRAEFDHHLFLLAIWRKKTFSKADQHIRFVCDTLRTITPYSENVKKMERIMNHPTEHSHYLKADTDPNFIINFLGKQSPVYRI